MYTLRQVSPARTGGDLNDPDSDQNSTQTGHAQVVIIHSWSVFYQVPLRWGMCGGKNPYCIMVSGIRGTLRGGYGVLYERQPLVCTLHVYAGSLGGCPVCYAAMWLDVVVVQYGHAEYQ